MLQEVEREGQEAVLAALATEDSPAGLEAVPVAAGSPGAHAEAEDSLEAPVVEWVTVAEAMVVAVAEGDTKGFLLS